MVTGGNGFLGSCLVKEMLNDGYEVSIFDIHDQNKFLTAEEKKYVQTYKGDLGNISHVMDSVAKYRPQIIFHLGTMLSLPSNNDPQSAYRINAGGTINVLEAARIFDVNKIIYSSSIAVYGRDIKGDVIDDYTLQRPNTAYGVYKTFSELIGHFYFNKYGVDFRTLRFSSIVGPGSKVKHVSVYNSWAIEKSYFGEPYDIFVESHTKCPIIYFKDAVRGLKILCEAPENNIRTRCYNLIGMEVKAKELEASIKRKMPHAQLHYKPEKEAMDFFTPLQAISFDDSRIREELGFELKYDLDYMVEDFYEVLAKDKLI